MSVPKEGGSAPADDSGPSRLEMSPEAMRELGVAAVDALVGRMDGLAQERPWRGASRAELEPLLREAAPERGRPAGEVMERALRDVLPVAARVDHPRFFAFVPSAPTWPGVVADFLTAGFNTFQGTWLGSGGPSQLELVVTDWFREWVGYPADTAGGLFTSGGSAASLDALVAAREHAGAPDRPAVFMSDQSHSALERAARIVGVRPEGIRKVASDHSFRIRMDALETEVATARAAGFNPIAVCANAGATNTGAVDPLHDLADYCAREGIWLHVDGAYGGFAILTERGRALLDGMERADSITLDAHKWLFQPFEAGCLLVKDVRTLDAAFSVHPEYLQDTRLGMEQVNFADRGLQLTRSFRALKVWMSVQTFGMQAFRRAVGRGIELADRAGKYIQASERLELMSPPSLGVVCFRAHPPGVDLDAEALERFNEEVQGRVIQDGTAMMSSTRLKGVYALRFCIMAHTTTWADVERTLRALEGYAGQLARS
ncbi:MAG TPA: aminotransferase class I/II-fold pyridoxal phosphate-dependent enzyme [Longimicrobiales bacterium]|nr:aminotransferase class I/II-fold pyridoxal phosphate-dependent enzyme [Longimicrobiales bacterium]